MISGASGFVGSALTVSLGADGCAVVGLSTRKMAGDSAIRYLQLDTADSPAEAIGGDLIGTDTFIHLAARTHSADLRDAAAAHLYRSVNIDLTMKLAKACADAGVQRFVFMSSVKACGERTADEPLREIDPAQPEDLYGRTKLEAENQLLQLASTSDMDVVILRAPLVYGPGVKGNFLRLLQWVQRGIPLPFAGVENRRSMIGLANLIDILKLCAAAPKGFRGRFFVSDGSDVSTPELISDIAALMRRSPRLVSVSPSLLKWISGLLGKRDLMDKLIGNLQVDSSLIGSSLGWRPRVSRMQELQATVQWFLGRGDRP